MSLQDYTINYKNKYGEIKDGLPILLLNVLELYVSFNNYYLIVGEDKLIAYYKYITIVDGYYAMIGNHKRIYNYTQYKGPEHKHIMQLQTMIDEVAVLFKD